MIYLSSLAPLCTCYTRHAYYLSLSLCLSLEIVSYSVSPIHLYLSLEFISVSLILHGTMCGVLLHCSLHWVQEHPFEAKCLWDLVQIHPITSWRHKPLGLTIGASCTTWGNICIDLHCAGMESICFNWDWEFHFVIFIPKQVNSSQFTQPSPKGAWGGHSSVQSPTHSGGRTPPSLCPPQPPSR